MVLKRLNIFVDETADKNQAEAISIDAKTQYPSACNSVETILIHKNYPGIVWTQFLEQ